MSKLTKLFCSNYGHPNDRNRGRCNICDEPLGYGYPNVNVYSDDYFSNGLNLRYEEVQKLALENGKTNSIELFEKLVNNNSKAIINTNSTFLFEIINRGEHYLPYRRAVEQKKRLIATIGNDIKRSVVDNCFYGMHGSDLVFATLSLDDNGLISYGDVSVILDLNFLTKRITVFEKNSFILYDELTKNEKWNPVAFPPPSGHYGIWENRGKLAIAKYYPDLTGSEIEADYASILLKCDGDRKTDEFIELHIYGKITSLNFQKIKLHNKLLEPKGLIELEIALEKLESTDIYLEYNDK